MEKIVGILTFHYARNYGATLQAYALQRKILECCDNVEIIDYKNLRILQEIALWNPCGKGVKNVLRTIVAFVYRARKKLAFHNFDKKYLKLSLPVTREILKEYAQKYNVLVTGSDQVWNMKLTNNDTSYYLDFANEKQLLIGYACSFGDGHSNISEEERFFLQKFDYISLRENNMQSHIEEITGKEVKICCDPTLFLTRLEWESIASPRRLKKPYLFLFMIEESPDLIEYAKQVAKEKGLELVSNKNCISFFKYPSPNDFLSWILYADFVLTNSFHGTIFSIIFQKHFLSHVISCDGKEKKRIIHLLKMCGLEHRILSNKNELEKDEKWYEIKKTIDAIQKESWNFMEYIINSASGGMVDE